MRRFFLSFLLALACFLPAPITSNSAEAASLTIRMRSFDKNVVWVKFHSKNRKVVWPGDGKAYPIRNFDVQSYKLNCVAGEQICYGAFTAANKTWGVGRDGKLGCKNCCTTCTDNAVSTIFSLNE